MSDHITRVDDDATGSTASCSCGWSARVDRSDRRILVSTAQLYGEEGAQRARGARVRAHTAAYAHRMANEPR